MKEEVLKKYIKGPIGLKSEVESFKRRFPIPEKGEWELSVYHETAIFSFRLSTNTLFLRIYQYSVEAKV
jgi:hypothetical protein